MTLPVPYVSQDKNAIRNDCGPACACMFLKAYKPVIQDYYDDMQIEPGSYQHVTDLIAWMGRRGVDSYWDILDGLPALRRTLDGGRPVIALINYKPLSDAGITFYKGSFTHFIIVVGYDISNVIVHDPYWPDERGAGIAVPNNVFVKAWSTVPAENGPNYGAVVPKYRLGEDMTLPLGKYIVVLTSSLRVREGPGTNYRTVDFLNKGDVVDVLEIAAGWGRIGYGRWSSMSYLSYTGEKPDVIDVSHWEVGMTSKFIDWAVVDLTKIQAVICKATQGIAYTDPTLGHNIGQLGINLNVKRGVYHFFENTTDPILQAKHFIDVLDGDYGELLPALDCEDPRATAGDAPKVKQFVDYFFGETGIKMMIYTSPGWWSSYCRGATWAADYKLWIAHYKVSTPTIPAPWTAACMWQYTEASLPGVVGKVDFNKVYTLPLR